MIQTYNKNSIEKQQGFFNWMGLLINWVKDLEQIVIDLKTKPNKKCFLQTSINSHYVIEDDFLVLRVEKAREIQESLNLIQNLFECNQPDDLMDQKAYRFLFTKIETLLWDIQQINQEIDRKLLNYLQ